MAPATPTATAAVPSPEPVRSISSGREDRPARALAPELLPHPAAADSAAVLAGAPGLAPAPALGPSEGGSGEEEPGLLSKAVQATAAAAGAAVGATTAAASAVASAAAETVAAYTGCGWTFSCARTFSCACVGLG